MIFVVVSIGYALNLALFTVRWFDARLLWGFWRDKMTYILLLIPYAFFIYYDSYVEQRRIESKRGSEER